MKQKTVGFIPWAVVIILIGVFVYLYYTKTNIPANPNNATTSTSTDQNQTATSTIEYRNSEYGFGFTLPISWKGYTIITSQWQGWDMGNSAQGEVVSETGPMISIRHPEWTSAIPRQDIPVMVFTLAQWDKLQNDEFHIGAAPIGPRELGQNSKYVFAIPARYNYAFLPGFEEVDRIINGKTAFQIF